MIKLFSVLSVALWLSSLGFGGEAPRAGVVPAPQEATLDKGGFEIDRWTVILVSERASEATRRAARWLQLAIRERFGMDLALVRIVEQNQFGEGRGVKDIWVVDPRANHPPASTIGVEGLAFSEAMRAEGYFLRVDMPEVVVHGASEAGTLYGVETLFQLIRPPRPGALFRAARGPTIPCLWIADWPASAVRPARVIRPPREPEGAEPYLRTLARLRLNAIPQDGPDWLAEGPVGARLRELAPQWFVKFPAGPPAAAKAGLPREAQVWDRPGPLRFYAEAMLADRAWKPTGFDLADFRRRFARAVFGTDAAAEAIQLTEECLERAPRPGHAIPFIVIGEAKGEEARQIARGRSDHERRARRVRTLWRSIQAEPALRDAFLAAAERAITETDVFCFAMGDAWRDYREGRIARAAEALRARLDSLGALGEDAAPTRKALEALIARLDAAAKAPQPPPINSVFEGGKP